MFKLSLTKIHPNYLNLFLFIYFIILPFIFAVHKVEYIIPLIVACIGFFSFLIGSKLNINIDFLSNEFHDTNFKKLILLIFLLIDINSILSYFFVGINQNAYNLGYLDSAGSNTLYKQIIITGLSFVKFYIYAGYMKNNKKLFFVIAFLSVLAAITGRVRFDIVKSLIFFGLFGISFNYIKVGWVKILIALIMSPFFMLITLIKRDYVGSIDFISLISVIKNMMIKFNENNYLWDMLKMSMESFATFDIYKNVINDGFVSPVNGVIRIIFNFIPRSIWVEKPLPLQIVLASRYNESAYLAGGGIFANIFGDAFINGGIFMVVIFMFILGMISNYLYKVSIKATTTKSLCVAAYAIFIIFFFNFYRGYLSDMTWQFILFFVVFKVLNMFEKR
ncbi:O-antigen polymerase [Paenibacillus ihuae]|uniref:O-antigen polymerase n=1 Tax=Paenibacillus ihuae TaxID=1232431 RepID=UPI0006D56EDC|nr:O-antigen polymerase [Paenibacillus ihuae]